MSLSPGQKAFMPSRFGVARFGATRVGYYQPTPVVTVNGVTRTSNVRLNGFTVIDLLNGTPNTATMRVWNFTPVKGQEIKVGLGGLGRSQLEFAGRILTTTQVYESAPRNVAWDLSCISYEWLLNRRKVTKRYLSQSATTIILDLMANFTSGFTTTMVESGLPSIDEITFTNEDVIDCLDRICKRIGADWFVDYGLRLNVFSSANGAVHDITDSDDHGMVGLAATVDLSQVKTRVLVEGMGSAASADIDVGQTTMPLDDTSPFPPGGGTVVSGPQRITYTGKSTIDGTGSKVGGVSGITPGVPTANVVSETSGNLSVGDYRYGVTFVINGGETEAGNNSDAVSIAHVTPPGGVTLAETTGGSLTTGSFYLYAVSFVTAAGETYALNSSSIQLTGANNRINLSSIPVSSDDRVTGRRIRRANGSTDGVWRLVTTINDNSTTTFGDTAADAGLTPSNPWDANSSGSGRIDLSDIPIGPTGTTARRIYRSPVNIVSNSGYKYLATVSGNVTTTYSDNIADTELGDAAPSASTVGPTAGDTSLPVQELSAFASGGGWVLAANQIIRYTGRSGSSGTGTLTGVPASGTGAIAAAIPYDVVVTNVPHLTGVSGVLYAINRGESVNLLVTRNDAAAQTAMAALVGGDGITEHYIQDRRLSHTEAENRGDAALLELKDPITTVRYQTRDRTTRTGMSVTINLGAPTNISGTFKIQRVTSTDYVQANLGTGWPLRTVEASSRLLTFEQLLRGVKAV